VKGFLGRFLRRKLMETEISGWVRNTELVKIIDWIPKVWHHLNRFLEAHSSSDVTIGRWEAGRRAQAGWWVVISLEPLAVL
jgi:neuron navigator 2